MTGAKETTHVLYHANCADGFGAAYAAWTVLGDRADYIPVRHGEDPPDLPADARVAIVDFTYSTGVLMQLKQEVADLIVLDHHKSEQDQLVGLEFARFDLHKSGARMAWEYWHPKAPLPRLLEYVEDRDLWRWDLPDSQAVSIALHCYPMEFDVWASLKVEDLLDEGRGILRYQKSLVDRAVGRARWHQVGGYWIPAVNSCLLQSEIGDELCLRYPEADFAGVYYVKTDSTQAWSLRSIGEFDVSEVARGLGGGGHRNAAGCALSEWTPAWEQDPPPDPKESQTMKDLTAEELVNLVQRVFQPGEGDRALAFLVDLPDERVPDEAPWSERRQMVWDWWQKLQPQASLMGLERVDMVLYPNVRANNADLPEHGFLHASGPLPSGAEELSERRVPFSRVFSDYQLLVAPTQFSATAPLKVKAREYGFRGATMPGFSRAMVPALALDYSVIAARVDRLKELVDRAVGCDILFTVDGAEHRLHLDLRHRTGHASGGVLTTPGTAGNLPSGETYIVPYEGEVEGLPSQSAGEMPVQFGEDVVIYRIVENRAVEVLTDNSASREEARNLAEEPAYGNLAELGLGVLGDMGVEPTGEVLLDEKLGLHIAFGRSEHFGGQVGPDSFSSPDRVVHIDRVYIPKLQPRITVTRAELEFDDGTALRLMEEGRYCISWPRS